MFINIIYLKKYISIVLLSIIADEVVSERAIKQKLQKINNVLKWYKRGKYNAKVLDITSIQS